MRMKHSMNIPFKQIHQKNPFLSFQAYKHTHTRIYKTFCGFKVPLKEHTHIYNQIWRSISTYTCKHLYTMMTFCYCSFPAIWPSSHQNFMLKLTNLFTNLLKRCLHFLVLSSLHPFPLPYLLRLTLYQHFCACDGVDVPPITLNIFILLERPTEATPSSSSSLTPHCTVGEL